MSNNTRAINYIKYTRPISNTLRGQMQDKYQRHLETFCNWRRCREITSILIDIKYNADMARYMQE
jgi:hypothetical protein